MNISYRSQDWRERILSNLAHTPFVMEVGSQHCICNSVEGFWQGLKCHDAMREHVFLLSGLAAKNAGRSKRGTRFEFGGRSYEVGSQEHEDLICAAVRAKVLQNPKAAQALLESRGILTHRVPTKNRPIFKIENLLRGVYLELSKSGSLANAATPQTAAKRT